MTSEFPSDFPDARACLRLAARAIEEDARRPRVAGALPPIPVEIAGRLRERARTLSPDAHDTACEILRHILALGRLLYCPSLRTDYLLVRLAYRHPEWRQPLKRRPRWLEEETR